MAGGILSIAQSILAFKTKGLPSRFAFSVFPSLGLAVLALRNMELNQRRESTQKAIWPKTGMKRGHRLELNLNQRTF